MNKTEIFHETKQQSHILKKAIRGNAIFSAISGIVAVLGAQFLATLTGIRGSTAFYVLGIILIIYAVDLWWVSSREPIDLRFAWAAIFLDLLWVLGSIGILITGWPALTTAGRWIVFFLAEIVAVFAILQYIGLRRSKL